MISADCDSVRDALDAFADGELRGDELRYVSQHVEACRRCTEEVEVRRTVGGMIRESVVHWHKASAPAGLASGVVTRARAESALSWQSLLNRAVEDWHWVIVGGGAVTATFVSMLLCSALLLLGTAKPREDSLSAIVRNLQASPGALYAEVSRQGGGSGVMVVQVETSAEPAETLPDVLTRADEERQWVGALGETLGSDGPLTKLASMSEHERRKAEWLLDNITRLRGFESIGPFNALKVYRLHLVTSTEVTAKGLRP